MPREKYCDRLRVCAMSAEERLAALLTADRGALLAFLRRRGANDAEAEDVIQSASLRALEALTRGSAAAPGDLRAWLFGIVKNTHIDAHRGLAARATDGRSCVDVETIADSLPTEALELSPEIGCQCLQPLVEKTLSPATAALVRAVDAGDSSVSEAARSLGLAANAASVRLHRARTTLREALASSCGPCCATYRGAASCDCGTHAH
jgi:RNA polymerase sigma-70 factor (ECF subfamily)